MALKVDYVLRETGANLRRNLTLTLASFLTVAVSLALVGAAALIRLGVDNATQQWKGGIEFIVYLNPEVTRPQSEAIGRELRANPEVRRFTFVSQQEAYKEFQDLFKSEPEMVDSISPEVLPASYRVVPRVADTHVIESVGLQFERRPGVSEVVFAKDVVDSVLQVGNFLQRTVIGVAVGLLIAALLLIFNTIRMAMFARRREIEVMKLVGATNWFIRVPFMVEGLLQGLLGAGIAFGVVAAGKNLVDRYITGESGLALFQQFAVAGSEVVGTGILLLVLGAVVGTVASGVAVTRFLDI